MLSYDAENRLVGVKKNDVSIASFVYNGDGARVKGVITETQTTTTLFVGGYFEWTGSKSTMMRYYTAGGTRLALRVGDGTGSSGLSYVFGDHLGSTSVTYRISDTLTTRQLYKAWGEPSYASASLPTKYTYTGQYTHMDDLATGGVTEGFGLMFYNARWYDPSLGRWNQPDTIVPEASQGVQAWDRYAYVSNSPSVYSDPTGHCVFGVDTAVCIELMIHLVAHVLVTDLADGSFDTPSQVSYSASTTANVLTGNPFGSYRDPTLAGQISGGGTPNLNNWLVGTMTANAAGPIAATLNNANSGGLDDKYAAYLGWAAMVKGGAPWDFKNDLSGIDSVVLGSSAVPMDMVANIHYGFVGSAGGFSSGELLAGAGVAQIAGGTSSLSYWNSNFDDPRDQLAIWIGIMLYKKYGLDLTVDQFIQTLDQNNGDQQSPQ